ncbi:MAG: OsmC family protein [Acidobacteriota bacterium]
MAEHKEHRVHLTLERGYRFVAGFPEVVVDPTISLDEPPPLGESHGPSAAALLGAAVGNCLGASLVFCLQKAHVDLPALDIDVTVRVDRNEQGRLRISTIDVTLVPAVGEHQAARLDRCRSLFEDFCTVTGSIRQGIPVNVTVRRDQPAAGTASTGTSA